jgi:hypothetical protein
MTTTERLRRILNRAGVPHPAETAAYLLAAGLVDVDDLDDYADDPAGLVAALLYRAADTVSHLSLGWRCMRGVALSQN